MELSSPTSSFASLELSSSFSRSDQLISLCSVDDFSDSITSSVLVFFFRACNTFMKAPSAFLTGASSRHSVALVTQSLSQCSLTVLQTTSISLLNWQRQQAICLGMTSVFSPSVIMRMFSTTGSGVCVVPKSRYLKAGNLKR